MRLASFRDAAGREGFGRLDGDRIFRLGNCLKAALAAGSVAALPDGEGLALADVTLLPPIPQPGKILCVGMNYASHRDEMGRTQMAHPAIFTRWADTLVAHGNPLVRPCESACLDYEGELAVVIGKPARLVSEGEAMDYVAGYAVFHDASVRDWQRHNIQFTPGKNFPGTGGFGPALVTPDEAGDIPAQRVQTRLNGHLVQDQPVSDLIFSIPALIAYCSTFTTLLPGDVIATGTPGGVGEKREPPLYMKGGDRVEVSIGSVGTLVNPVVDEG